MQLSLYPKYDRLGASSRMRIYQFLNELEKNYQIKINTLFPKSYINNLYNYKKQNKLAIIHGYIKRFIKIIFDNSDIIIIEKDLFPYIPYWIEKICLFNKKYIVDIDDAVFHLYDKNKNKFIRSILSNKFNQLFSHSDYVWAGSLYLLNTALSAGAKKAELIPTVIDIERYTEKNYHLKKKSLVIGWIGTNTTVINLNLILDSLEQVQNSLLNIDIELYVIGSKLDKKPLGLKVTELEWDEDSEVELIKEIDIGIMPLEDSLWNRGKCAYKIIQYMACSIPVIASSVGANNFVIDHGVTGYLCASKEDWYNYFTELILDKDKRFLMGKNGRNKVEQNYTIQHNIKKMQQSIKEILCAG